MSKPAHIRDWRGVQASCIAPGLWQSGLPMPFASLQDQGIGLVVLAAAGVQPGPEEIAHIRRVCPKLKLITAPLDDVEDEDAMPEIARVANQVADRVAQRMSEGRTALVTCQVGRNRSGLISALVLMRLHGLSGSQAVDQVRTARELHLPPGEEALSNDTFRAYLRSLPAGAR